MISIGVVRGIVREGDFHRVASVEVEVESGRVLECEMVASVVGVMTLGDTVVFAETATRNVVLGVIR